jgi:hypothetical protein
VPNLEGLDNTQRAAAQAVMPILPALVDHVVRMVNVPKASPGSKKVAKDDPEERKIFLVSPVFYYVDYLYSRSE